MAWLFGNTKDCEVINICTDIPSPTDLMCKFKFSNCLHKIKYANEI